MQGSELTGRFEYYDQTQLRVGTKVLDRTKLSLPDQAEIQQETLNRSYWLGYDHVFNSHWALAAEVPYYVRYHTTIAPGDSAISTSRGRGIGDMRFLARYQNHTMTQGWSLQMGLKLPSGGTRQTFVDGPQAGAPLDRALQLGTGSTDLLLGATYFRRITPSIGTFTQILWAQPVTGKDDFRPGTALNMNLGMRWLNTSRVTPQVQLNARWDGREHGANSDNANSGDTIVDVSPGATVEVTDHLNAFVFVQIPAYQRLNGRQLEPRWLFSTGFRLRL